MTFSCISPILNTESKRFFRRFCYGRSPDCRPLGPLADPDDPDALVPAYTTDGVHHTPAGQRALAALMPENIFEPQTQEE